MFYSTKVGGGRSGGLHGYDLFAPKLPVLSSPQEFFSRSERCGEAQCVAFFRAPRLFPFSSFSHSNIVFVFYSTHYPTDAQIILPHVAALPRAHNYTEYRIRTLIEGHSVPVSVDYTDILYFVLD